MSTGKYGICGRQKPGVTARNPVCRKCIARALRRLAKLHDRQARQLDRLVVLRERYTGR